MLKKAFTYKSTILYLFLALCIFYSYVANIDNLNLLFVNKIAIFLFLMAYYIVSSKKLNYYFLFFLILGLLSGAIFCLDRKSVLGFIFLLLSKIVLCFVIYKKSIALDKQILITSFFLFFITSLAFLSMTYENTIKFNVAVLIAFFSVLILTLSFGNLLKTKKYGNSEMMIGLTLFLFCDVVFSLNRLIFFESNRVLLVGIFYHTAYYFICTSMIKKSQIT